jgi:type I restriction enzyme R subunit
MNWRDHIATSLSIEPNDFDYTPFLVSPKPSEGGNQRGGLGNLSVVALAKMEAHQLFGEQLSKLLDELNEVLAA